jgi:hypothetical protein
VNLLLWLQMLTARYVVELPHGRAVLGTGCSGEA